MRCRQQIRALLGSPQPKVHQPPLHWTVADHRTWGDNIIFRGRTPDGMQQEWVGWTQRTPRVGDVFEVAMHSGRTAAFTVVKVRRCTNPSDMWFAETDIETGRYLDEGN